MKPKIVLWLTVGGMALLAAGCGKHSEAPAQSTATTAADTPQPHANSQSSTPGAQPPAAGSNPAAEAQGAPDLADLSRQLRSWIVGHRRLPQSFEEFASTANLKVPPPPAGKKYAINKSTVVLVDR